MSAGDRMDLVPPGELDEIQGRPLEKNFLLLPRWPALELKFSRPAAVDPPSATGCSAQNVGLTGTQLCHRVGTTSNTYQKEEIMTYKNEAIATLHTLVKPGDTVYTTLRQVSSNGMSRHLQVLVVKDGRIRNITRLVAQATGDRLNEKTESIVLGGTGMDMGFALVYGLSRTLYADGHKCTGSDGNHYYTPSGAYKAPRAPRCPSNDHSNDYGSHVRAWEAECEAIGRNRTEANAHTFDTMRVEFIDKASKRDYSRSRVHNDGGYALNHRWA